MNNNNKIVLAILIIGAFSGCSMLVSDSMIKGMHQDMDSNNDGYINYSEYLKNASDDNVAQEAKEKGMSIEEYQKWDFNRADENRDGKVTKQEMIDLFRKEF